MAKAFSFFCSGRLLRRAPFPFRRTPLRGRALDLLQVGVAFDEFFCAAAREADAQAAVVFVAFHSHYRAYAIFCVADFLAEQGIGVGSAFEGRPREIAGWRRTPGRRS